jgi:hypothetical protein
MCIELTKKTKMPVDVNWLYENRVIKVRHYGKVTSAQLVASIEKSVELTRQGQWPVHTLVDGRDVEGAPDVALGDLRKLIPTVTEGSGLMVVIQPRVRDRFFTSLGMQIAGARYKFAEDMESALMMLLEHDPTLNDTIR